MDQKQRQLEQELADAKWVAVTTTVIRDVLDSIMPIDEADDMRIVRLYLSELRYYMGQRKFAQWRDENLTKADLKRIKASQRY